MTHHDELAGPDRIRARSGWSYTGIVDAVDAVLTFPSATAPIPGT